MPYYTTPAQRNINMTATFTLHHAQVVRDTTIRDKMLDPNGVGYRGVPLESLLFTGKCGPVFIHYNIHQQRIHRYKITARHCMCMQTRKYNIQHKSTVRKDIATCNVKVLIVEYHQKSLSFSSQRTDGHPQSVQVGKGGSHLLACYAS